MSCIKNPKRFLFVKYNGEHQEEVVRVGKFMWTSDNFKVRLKCKNCGAERVRHFVTWDELHLLGLSNDEIKIANETEF